MQTRQKLGYACLGLIVLVASLVGMHYLVSPEITSYHKQVIGVRWDELAPGVQTLLIILMKGTGLGAVIAAVSIGIITAVPLRRGESWARWAVLAIGLTLLAPMLAGSLYLAITTGAASPWWLNSLAIILLFAGFVLVDDRQENRGD